MKSEAVAAEQMTRSELDPVRILAQREMTTPPRASQNTRELYRASSPAPSTASTVSNPVEPDLPVRTRPSDQN